jgi:hypothetical protein
MSQSVEIMSQSVETMGQNRVHMSTPGQIVFLERGVAYGSDWPLLQLTEFLQISACLSRSSFLRLRCRQERLLCLPATLNGWAAKNQSKQATGFPDRTRESCQKLRTNYGETVQGSRKAHARFALRYDSNRLGQATFVCRGDLSVIACRIARKSVAAARRF